MPHLVQGGKDASRQFIDHVSLVVAPYRRHKRLYTQLAEELAHICAGALDQIAAEVQGIQDKVTEHLAGMATHRAHVAHNRLPLPKQPTQTAVHAQPKVAQEAQRKLHTATHMAKLFCQENKLRDGKRKEI